MVYISVEYKIAEWKETNSLQWGSRRTPEG